MQCIRDGGHKQAGNGTRLLSGVDMKIGPSLFDDLVLTNTSAPLTSYYNLAWGTSLLCNYVMISGRVLKKRSGMTSLACGAFHNPYSHRLSEKYAKF